MNQPIEVIEIIANCLDGEGVDHVESIDESSGTLIVFCTDGNPYEVRVRRVTEADCAIDNDGVLPEPITPQRAFCCSEVARLANRVRAVGAPDVARALLVAHAEAGPLLRGEAGR